MKMPLSNIENYAGNGEDEVTNLLKQLWIDEGEDAGFEGTCKHLGLQVMQKTIDSEAEEESDEESDSDAEEVNAGRHADPDSEDEDNGLECCIKCLPPSAVQIILDGYRQEEIVKALKAQCDKYRDPAEKLKFLTRPEALVQGYSVTPITYTAFTNKTTILKFLLDEFRLNCGISLRHLSEHLDQRDRDGNNMLMAMASSQLDLSEAFEVLFNFHHYPHKDNKKYFLVNHGLINHKGETIFMILERNDDITSERKERIRKTLQELIERPEFEKEWIGDVLTSTNHQLPVEEDAENNQERFVQIVQDVSDPHANITIREDSQPNAAPNPEQILDPVPAVGLHEQYNPDGESLQDIPIPAPQPLPQAIQGPGPANVPADIPAPGFNFQVACAFEACGAVYQTMQEAQQCAQSHGENDVLLFDESALQDGGDMAGVFML